MDRIMKYVFFFALSLVICGCAVKKTERIDLFFGLPEYPNSVYEIDFRHSRMTCTKVDYGTFRDSIKKRKYAGEGDKVRLSLESREKTTTLDLHQLRAECNR